MGEQDPGSRAPNGQQRAGVCELPLVTFALFAYNQEDYVREAIEAAFAQTYQPLEIILSDDCSSDRTFAIMQEMAAAYSGPHKVIARQSPQNRRVLRHVLDVVNIANGKYMVVQAGDDVSLPERTERLVETFEIENADFCWSAYSTIDQNPSKVTVFKEDFHLQTYLFNLPIKRIPGAMSAYRLEVMKQIPPIHEPIMYEDNFLELLSVIKNLKVSFCNEDLVKYRILSSSLSLRGSDDVSTFERNLNTRLDRLADTVILTVDTFCDAEEIARRPEIRDCRRQAVFYKTASGWKDLPIADKAALLLRAPDTKAVKWLLPRMVLGWSNFIRLKGILQKLRSKRQMS